MSAKEELHEEFVVCFAPAYPDPHRVWPQTLESARAFVARHGGQIKRRLVSEWEDIDDSPPGSHGLPSAYFGLQASLPSSGEKGGP